MKLTKKARWGLLAIPVVVAFTAWSWWSYYFPFDPYAHELTIAHFYNACTGDCEAGNCRQLTAVSWHLRTTAPATSTLPVPGLEGMVCQTGTHGTAAETCTARFEIAPGEIDASPPYLKLVPDYAEPLQTTCVVHLELLVGAKHSAPNPNPTVESKTQIEVPLGALEVLPP
jgi:hypothetical protein